jgi:hypothetical protein
VVVRGRPQGPPLQGQACTRLKLLTFSDKIVWGHGLSPVLVGGSPCGMGVNVLA